jgi:ribonuclease BN (tRNA processing enzyme)
VSLAVTVLGSSGMFATSERACAGYLVEIGDARVWLDAGAGTWRNLLGIIDYSDLNAVLLSHRHPDHTTDVFQAFHARQYGGRRPLSPVPLWAPEETLERVCSFGGEIDESFDLRPIGAPGVLELAGATLSFVRMAHPPETLGVRVELDGRVLAYSSDTGPSADLAALARGADLFICESTLQDSDPEWEGHLSASQAGRAAARLGVGRLLLTHLPPHRDLSQSLAQARASADGIDVGLAHDGLRVEVAP